MVKLVTVLSMVLVVACGARHERLNPAGIKQKPDPRMVKAKKVFNKDQWDSKDEKNVNFSKTIAGITLKFDEKNKGQLSVAFKDCGTAIVELNEKNGVYEIDSEAWAVKATCIEKEPCVEMAALFTKKENSKPAASTVIYFGHSIKGTQQVWWPEAEQPMSFEDAQEALSPKCKEAEQKQETKKTKKSDSQPGNNQQK